MTAANEVFTQLRDLGVQLQIDDFGSGYSALSYLQHFPISAIKIDKSFIDEMGKGRRGTELIRAIVSMTHELGMETIAEGIETSQQLEQLKSLSCNFGQGFLLSRPLDKEAAEKILAKQKAENRGRERIAPWWCICLRSFSQRRRYATFYWFSDIPFDPDRLRPRTKSSEPES